MSAGGLGRCIKEQLRARCGCGALGAEFPQCALHAAAHPGRHHLLKSPDVPAWTCRTTKHRPGRRLDSASETHYALVSTEILCQLNGRGSDSHGWQRTLLVVLSPSERRRPFPAPSPAAAPAPAVAVVAGLALVRDGGFERERSLRLQSVSLRCRARLGGYAAGDRCRKDKRNASALADRLGKHKRYGSHGSACFLPSSPRHAHFLSRLR